MRTVDAIRKHPGTQLLGFAMVSPKSELGFMLITPDLHDSQRFEKQISLALGADVLTPAYSYLSMTEWTEYSQSEEEFKAQLEKAENLTPGTEAFEKRLGEWKGHMTKYYNDRPVPEHAGLAGLLLLPDEQAPQCGRELVCKRICEAPGADGRPCQKPGASMPARCGS